MTTVGILGGCHESSGRTSRQALSQKNVLDQMLPHGWVAWLSENYPTAARLQIKCLHTVGELDSEQRKTLI